MQVQPVLIYVTFMSDFQTWNVVDNNRNTLFYGSAEEVDHWLADNKDKYREEVAR